MRAIVPLLALSALFAGCVIDVPDDDYDGGHHLYEPIATAAFTWEFYPGLSCAAAEVDTVTVVIDDLRYTTEQYTDSCYAGTITVDGLAPGTYHVEAFGDPSGWWTAYDVDLYDGYNDVTLRLR
jgi:hypothetical protein